MPVPPTSSLEQYFGELPDPREGQNIQHPLLSIVSIAICGADHWVDVEMFGQAKQAWLETFLDLPHGIPWHDTFGRVFRRINAEAFEQCFSQWTQALCSLTAGEVVALDGKHVWQSKDSVPGREGLRLVSAGTSDNAVMLTQVPVDEGHHEIPTLLKLVGLLDTSEAVITIDGTGCQTEIAAALAEQHANYVLAVKGNQTTLAYTARPQPTQSGSLPQVRR